MTKTVFSILLASLAAVAMAAPPDVSQGPHNLAVTGPEQKVASEQRLCIACHVPHITAGVKPLWDASATVSQTMPATTRPVEPTHATLRPTESRLPDSAGEDTGGTGRPVVAYPGQPTGVSKLCLSCHDGTIAPGNIVARNQLIQTAERMTTTPHGKRPAGTDLSDDHPISIRFDAVLARQKPWLKDPNTLSGKVALDKNGEMQCTSCHDPHDNANGKFLTIANADSGLCNTCHQVGPTTVTNHTNCLGCHQNHTSPSGIKLLKQATITGTCVSCHGGGTTKPQGPNVGDDIRKFANHDTSPPIELAKHSPGDSACSDCHDPHTMQTATATAPGIRGNFGHVAGVSAQGTPVKIARYEYEVCFRCHGDKQELVPRITRAINQPNMRLKLSTSAVSFHPVEGRGVNMAVTSLKPEFTTASTIYCTDCHSSDSGKKAGGSGASGPHGSENAGLLVEQYETADYTAESSQSYALCYRCHDRASILSDQSFKLHKIHIADRKTPCSACHDPHGISSTQGTKGHNSFLINFDARIVQKSSNGKREFTSTGVRTGTCSLNCHGVDHFGFGY